MVHLDEILDTFDRLWREGKPRPVLAEFLGQFSLSGNQRLEALAELVAIDMEYHWRVGGPQEASSQADTASGAAAATADTRPELSASRPMIEDYAKQWPEIRGDDPRFINLIAEEYRIRQRFGDRPSEEEYVRRFGDTGELRRALAEVRQELLADQGEIETQTVILTPPFEGVETKLGQAEDTAAPPLQEFGRYRLLKHLGKGGMGQVFLAEDTHLERRVALKMPHLEEGEALRDRFVNEAKAAAMLRHPGICPVFDAGEIDGQPFLTMAFIEGETLREHWRRGDRVSPAEMLQVLIEIARAMQIAHAAGIVHRDLKPSNVMIDENGHAVVMDFGLAYRASIPQDERITQTGDTLGTPGYMSPEQVEGPAGEIGSASDIYSLGVMLFEALTGRLPFTGSISSILIQIARDQPTAPSDWKKEIDAELEQFCLQMLSKDPKARPHSMREVADRLTTIQGRLKVESVTPTAGFSLAKASSRRKPAGKKRSTVALAALGIALLLGALVFRIQTPYGTVTIEVASEAAKDVQVRVLKEGKVIEVADASSGWSLKLKEGEYEFDLGQAEASFSISPRTVRISKGETEIVKVAIADNAPRKAGETKDNPQPKIDLASVMDEKDFALSFDGQDDYVEIPTLTYDGSHPLTIEAWVTTYSLPSYAGIIGNKTRSGEPGGLSLMFISLMGERFWHVGVNGASAKGRNAYVWPSDERFEKVKVGERTHIAGVWDGQRLTLFVNGWKNDNMVSDGARGPVDRVDLVPSEASFLFGAESPGKLHFEGAIDEVRFSKNIRYRKDFTPPQSFKSDEHTLALYHFDEGSGDVLKDTSGHGHHGKIHGALWVPGPVKTTLPEHDAAIAATPREDPPALFFDGTNDYVHIPYAPVDGRPPLTIEAWIRPEPDESRWGKDPSGYIVSTAGFDTGLGLHLGGPKEAVGAVIYSLDKQVIGEIVQRPELGEWSHVAAVWKEDALRFYWNGRLKREWPVDFTQILGWSSWRLGRRSGNTPIGFRGAMREVRISTVARYKDHFRPQWRFEPDDQTLALYHFDEGSGDVLIDSSGQGRYGRHGRIVGAEWTPSKAEGPPEENRALSFDGVDDHVITPIVYDGSHPITVEAWVAAADPWENGIIMANRSHTGFSFGQYVHAQNPVWQGIVFAEREPRALVDLFVERGRMPRDHLAMVWDGQQTRLFVNGALKNWNTSPLAEMPKSGRRILLGSKWEGYEVDLRPQVMFNGLIDEVRISRVARYHQPFMPQRRFEPDEETLALYHCDEGDGDVLRDASGRGNHAKIIGATPVPAVKMNTPGPYYEQLKQFSIEAARPMLPRKGPALEFFKPDARVEVPRVDLDFTKPFSLEFWATPDANFQTEASSRYLLKASALTLKIFQSNDTEPWDLAIFNWPNVAILTTLLDQSANFDRRTHIAAQWDGEHLQLFINGRRCPGREIARGSFGDLKSFLLEQLATVQTSGMLLGNYSADWQQLGNRSNRFGGTIDAFRISRGVRYPESFEPSELKTDEATVLLYDFHEGQGDVLHDLSGNGYHGKIVGAKWLAPEPAEKPAKADKPNRDLALSFNGLDDHVITPIVYDGSHPITVEAWVAAADPWENGVIICNYTEHYNGFKIRQYVQGHNPVWHGLVFGGDSSRPLVDLFRRPDFEPKTHLAMVWDGEEIRLYVNGEKQQSTIRPLKQMPGSQERIRLGTKFDRGEYATDPFLRFHGLVDEVRISKVARYDAKFQPSNRFEPDEDTWALYHCDELDGDILKDASGNGNDAQIYGGATRKPASELHSPSEYYRQLEDWVRQTARKMPERSGPALEFSATNAYVEVPAVEFDFTKPFTVEAWATPHSGYTAPDINARAVVNVGNLSLKLDPYPGHEYWKFNFWNGKGLMVMPWRPYSVHYDRRTHLVAQWDGEHLSLYVNGIRCPGKELTLGSVEDLDTFIREHLSSANGQPLGIGNKPGGGSPFGGTIDRFRLSRGVRYEKAFDPTDFKADDSTIVMFDFHEGRGDVLHDLSGNGYHGKIVGAKWVGTEGKHLPAVADKPDRD